MIIRNVTKIHRFISLVHIIGSYVCRARLVPAFNFVPAKKYRAISTGCELVQWEEHKKGYDVNAMVLT